jgi:hypothetical protein
MPATGARGLLQGVQTFQSYAVTANQEATRKKSKTLQEELESYLFSKQAEVECCTLFTCSPMHVQAFIAEYWINAHQGIEVSGGRLNEPGRIASPQSVKNAISSLRVMFAGMGRVGNWSPETPGGNPMSGTDWAAFQKKYERHAVDRGYKPASAMPATIEEYVRTMQHLLPTILDGSKPNKDRVLTCMHAVAIGLMWSGGCRLDTVSQLQATDLVYADGSPAFADIWPNMSIPVGVDIYVHSQVQKGRVGYTNKRFLICTETVNGILSPIWTIHLLLGLCAEANQPITGFLMRSLVRGRAYEFLEKGISADVLGTRIGAVLDVVGLKDHLSAYSFVKGGSQAEYAAGKSSAEITIDRGRKSVSVHEKHYLSRDRQAGSKRVKCSNDNIS